MAAARRSGLVATIISGVLFGTSVPVIKLGLDATGLPLLFGALRFLTASAIVLLVLRNKGWVKTSLYRSKPVWVVGAINTFGYVTQFVGQDLTTASDAALIIGSASLMIPILSRIQLKESLHLNRGLGVILGFIGTSLVVTRGEPLTLGGPQFVGDLLILFTAFTIALIFVFSKKMVDREGSSAVTGGILLTTSLLLLPSTLWDGWNFTSFGPDAWFYVLFLAVFSTVGAYYFFTKGLESVTPIVSSIILPIEVIVSVALSVLIFRDPFNTLSGTGAALIVAGVLLVSLSK